MTSNMKWSNSAETRFGTLMSRDVATGYIMQAFDVLAGRNANATDEDRKKAERIVANLPCNRTRLAPTAGHGR